MSTPRFLLDTNVIIQLIRWNNIGKRIDARFGLLASSLPVVISAVSLGETRSLAMQWGWTPDKVEKLHTLLSKLLVMDIRREPIIVRYALLDHRSQSVGRKMNKNDLWIAATAAATNTTILTTDKDFDHLDESLVKHQWIDPQSSASS